MKEIQLTQGKVALVDDEDFERLNQWKWRALHNRNTYYAIRNAKKFLLRTIVYMHREIMNVQNDMMIDHADSNGLNNCKSNLRICNNSQNMQNRKKPITNTSGYKGVTRSGKRWRAYVAVNGIKKYLGTFDNPEQAAQVYEKEAKLSYKEFARTNDIF